MPRDNRALEEVALTCRVLSITLCTGYCLVLFIMGIALGTKSSDVKLHKIAESPGSRASFFTISAVSFLGSIMCALFITSTYVVNMWLAIPYFVMHIIILITSLVLMGFYICSIQQLAAHHNTDQNAWEGFVSHVFFHSGSFPIFSAVLLLSLLVYALFPMWKFINQCRLRREEKRKEVKPRKVVLVGGSEDVFNLERPEGTSSEQESSSAAGSKRRQSMVRQYEERERRPSIGRLNEERERRYDGGKVYPASPGDLHGHHGHRHRRQEF